MALYKPGDKVTIVNFQPELHYRFGYNYHMQKLSGTIQEIESITHNEYMNRPSRPEFNNDRTCYKLRGSEWSWSCEMFEESYEI